MARAGRNKSANICIPAYRCVCCPSDFRQEIKIRENTRNLCILVLNGKYAINSNDCYCFFVYKSSVKFMGEVSRALFAITFKSRVVQGVLL